MPLFNQAAGQMHSALHLPILGVVVHLSSEQRSLTDVARPEIHGSGPILADHVARSPAESPVFTPENDRTAHTPYDFINEGERGHSS